VEKENLTYSRGVLSAEQLQSEVSRFWRDWGASPELEGELRAAGFNYGALAEIQDSGAITVRVGSSGADPSSVLLIIAFAPAANRVLKDLWKAVLLPRIQRRWGDDAIGEETGSAGR
jgi:hypothetical protein